MVPRAPAIETEPSSAVMRPARGRDTRTAGTETGEAPAPQAAPPGRRAGADQVVTQSGKSLRVGAELVVIVAVALCWRSRSRPFSSSRTRIPSASMEPTLTIDQRILVDRIGMPLQLPADRGHHGLPSAGRLRRRAPIPAGGLRRRSAQRHQRRATWCRARSPR